MIETFLDEAKLPSRTMEQKVFDAAVDYVFRNFPKWGREVNAALGALNSMAAGGAYAFPYVFDSATVDGDPGVGKIRLGSTSQNASTVMRMDVQIVGGVDISNVLADLRAATSSVKGSIRLVKMTDPSKWMIFDVTAVALPSGYRNLTVSARAASGPNPFTNGDALIVYIDRNGDVGTAGGTELLATYAVNPAVPVANIDSFNFTDGFEKYVIEFNGVQPSTGAATDMLVLRLFNSTGGLLSTGYQDGSRAAVTTSFHRTTQTMQGTIEIRAPRSSLSNKGIGMRGTFYDASNTIVGFTRETQYGVPSTIVGGFRLYWDLGANFIGGSIKVYGVRGQ